MFAVCVGGGDLSDVCGVCVGGLTFLMFAVCVCVGGVDLSDVCGVWVWGGDLSDVCCVCVGGG